MLNATARGVSTGKSTYSISVKRSKNAQSLQNFFSRTIFSVLSSCRMLMTARNQAVFRVVLHAKHANAVDTMTTTMSVMTGFNQNIVFSLFCHTFDYTAFLSITNLIKRLNCTCALISHFWPLLVAFHDCVCTFLSGKAMNAFICHPCYLSILV